MPLLSRRAPRQQRGRHLARAASLSGRPGFASSALKNGAPLLLGSLQPARGRWRVPRPSPGARTHRHALQRRRLGITRWVSPTNPMPAPALHPPQPPSQKVRCPGWAEGPGTHTLTPFPYPACSRLISRSGGLGGRERAATPRRAAHRRRAGASAWGVPASSLGG